MADFEAQGSSYMKTLAIQDLAQRVARELSSPAPAAQVQAILERTVEAIKDELQRGNRVELPHFLTLSVKPGQPVAAPSAAEGAVHLPPARLFQAELDEEFRKRIEGATLYRILLVVPHKHFFVNVMAARLSTARSQVTVVAGVAEALQFLAAGPADLIVLDSGLEDGARICAAVKRTRERASTGIIRILGAAERPAGEATQAVKDFEVLCDETVQEPFELTELVTLAEAELARAAEERNYFDHEMHFKLHTTADLVARANELAGELLAQSGLDEEDREKMVVAFREALDNAARHGNRHDANKLIGIQYLLDREKVTLVVEDQGEGFDPQRYLGPEATASALEAARSRNHSGQAGGLGILLMRKCTDKLEYNAVGNRITLCRYIRRGSTAA